MWQFPGWTLLSYRELRVQLVDHKKQSFLHKPAVSMHHCEYALSSVPQSPIVLGQHRSCDALGLGCVRQAASGKRHAASGKRHAQVHARHNMHTLRHTTHLRCDEEASALVLVDAS